MILLLTYGSFNLISCSPYDVARNQSSYYLEGFDVKPVEEDSDDSEQEDDGESESNDDSEENTEDE